MPSANRTIEIDVSPAELMAVITDFERYPDFIPEMVSAKIVRQTGDIWEVAYGIQVIRRLDYTLKLKKLSPTRVEWSLVKGVFKANNGSWDLTPLDDGTRTKAEYTIDIKVGMFLPGSLVRSLVGKTLPNMLDKFKERAESL